VAPALFLFFFAPVSAEYLIGYDDIIGDAAALIFGLLIFGPLYGAPAVLIRETTRRAGRGWPSMLLLALAFGLVQAGLIDQSLFNPNYRAIPYWDEMREPTLIPAIGVSASMAFEFLKGHVFGSICAPIALAEALVPQRSTRPWLGPVGLAVMAVLWLLAAWLVLMDTLAQEAFTASPAQLAATTILVVVLVVVAFRLPPTAGRPVESGPVPAPLVVGLLSLGLLDMGTVLGALGLEPFGWPATGIALGAVVVWLVAVGRWSRRRGWDGRHVLAAAAGSLLGVAGTAFVVEPLGDVPAMAKYVTNAVLLAIVVGLVAWAARAQRGYRRTTRAGTSPFQAPGVGGDLTGGEEAGEQR
jgi:hypothetical protein